MPVLWLRKAQSGGKSPKISRCAQNGPKSRNFTAKAGDHRKPAGLAQNDLDSLKIIKTNQNGPNAANFTKRVDFTKNQQIGPEWPKFTKNQQAGPQGPKITNKTAQNR